MDINLDNASPLQKARLGFIPRLPKQFEHLKTMSFETGGATSSVCFSEELTQLFPLTFGQPLIAFQQGKEQITLAAKKVGVVFSGGQAAGGHNVITGLFDALNGINPHSRLVGFLGGPSGIVDCKAIELTAEKLASYRNQGGFDLIGSGRTKIEKEEQLKASLDTVLKLDLDGLVVIGGDDSNTNAAVLAEYFKNNGCKTQVIGVPKTIDGDLKNEQIEISFGFDTACRVYSEAIGNILKDCLSAKKYYHFIKLMGRSASHITLECAFQTHPNMALISEEVAERKMTLRQVTDEIVEMICRRSSEGKNYGAILIPEGLIEFIPEVGTLINEINTLLSSDEGHAQKMDMLASLQMKIDYIHALLSHSSQACFMTLPQNIQAQLLLERDPHGNVQVSLIATEQLLIGTVSQELKKLKAEGVYTGSFHPQPHFFGYEGRCSLPSNFDAQYCYALGHTAALLIQAGASGYMSAVHHLDRPVEDWEAGGVPLTMMMHMEKRHGRLKPVIQKALVDLEGNAFATFKKEREKWASLDAYRCPGPIQFFGARDLTEDIPITLRLSPPKCPK